MQPVIGTSNRCPHCRGALQRTDEDRNGSATWIRVVSPTMWEFSSAAPVGEESTEPGTLVCPECDKSFRVVKRN